MNKSITKFTLFFALLGIAFLSSGTMASNSVDYYKELFRSWNLTIDTIETQEDTAGINYVVEPQRMLILLVLTAIFFCYLRKNFLRGSHIAISY